MSTIIKVIPVPHTTKRTTCIRIPSDGQIMTRVEYTEGIAIDKSFDFDGYDEGTFSQVNNEPVISVSSQKLGVNARFIIAINEFYDSALEGDNIPQERFLWYSYTTAVDDAPADDTPLTATPQNPLYILWSSGGTPTSPTIPFNVTIQNTRISSLYLQLGSVNARRNNLKEKILDIIENPIFPFILAGGSMETIIPKYTNLNFTDQIRTKTTVTEDKDYSRRLQGFIFRLEMLTRAISVDSNLESKQKFNLLDGEILLDFKEVFSKIQPELGLMIHNNSERTGWNFLVLGTVGSRPGYKYILPTANAQGEWTATSPLLFANPISILIGSTVPEVVTDNWIAWLFS